MFSMTRSKIVTIAVLSFVWASFAHAVPAPAGTSTGFASSKGGHSKSKASSRIHSTESASEEANSAEIKKPAVKKHHKKSK